MERQNDNLGVNEENETSMSSGELLNEEKIIDDNIDNSSPEITTTLEDETPTDTLESPINSVDETVAVQENKISSVEDSDHDIVETLESEKELIYSVKIRMTGEITIIDNF